MAYSLFDKTNETNVCVFDTEDSVENIYDHVFPQVPDVVVGKFNITPESSCICVAINSYLSLN